MSNANDILMGAGSPAVKILQGDTVQGRITAISEPYQEKEYVKGEPGTGKLKTFPSGDPIMTFTIDLATNARDASVEDDDGVRRLYMDGARIKKVLRTAVLAAGARNLQIGGVITLTCTHYDEAGDVRSGKNYTCTYQPPAPGANNVLMGQPAPQQQPQQPVYQAPQQPVYQAPAPQYAPQPQYTQQAAYAPVAAAQPQPQAQYVPNAGPQQAAMPIPAQYPASPQYQQAPAPQAAPPAPAPAPQAAPDAATLAALIAANMDPRAVLGAQFPDWAATYQG